MTVRNGSTRARHIDCAPQALQEPPELAQPASSWRGRVPSLPRISRVTLHVCRRRWAAGVFPGGIAPWNRADGYVVGKGEITCEDKTQSPFLRMRVELEYRKRVHATWRTVASLTEEVSAGTVWFFVKVRHACGIGGWRSSVTT